MTRVLLLTLTLTAGPSQADPGPLTCGPSDANRLLQLEAALVRGDYRWRQPACPSASLWVQAHQRQTSPHQHARQVAERLGGLPLVKARLLLSSPSFSNAPGWRDRLARVGGEAVLIADLRERYPDFRNSHDIPAAGHPAIDEAVVLLEWQNPDLRPESHLAPWETCEPHTHWNVATPRDCPPD